MESHHTIETNQVLQIMADIVDRIADILIEDHIELMKENELLRRQLHEAQKEKTEESSSRLPDVQAQQDERLEQGQARS